MKYYSTNITLTAKHLDLPIIHTAENTRCELQCMRGAIWSPIYYRDGVAIYACHTQHHLQQKFMFIIFRNELSSQFYNFEGKCTLLC